MGREFACSIFWTSSEERSEISCRRQNKNIIWLFVITSRARFIHEHACIKNSSSFGGVEFRFLQQRRNSTAHRRVNSTELFSSERIDVTTTRIITFRSKGPLITGQIRLLIVSNPVPKSNIGSFVANSTELFLCTPRSCLARETVGKFLGYSTSIERTRSNQSWIKANFKLIVRSPGRQPQGHFINYYHMFDALTITLRDEPLPPVPRAIPDCTNLRRISESWFMFRREKREREGGRTSRRQMSPAFASENFSVKLVLREWDA